MKALVAKNPKVEIDQKNCEFVPYALAIHQDQPLVIKSSDPVNHNVRYAAFTNAAFNQILAPNGQLEVKLVAERRPILVDCDIHPWMKGYIMVFDHPFFAVTGEDGSFEIKGVPAGAQNLVVWQEKVGYVNPEKAKGMPVTVKAGEATDVGAVTIDPPRSSSRRSDSLPVGSSRTMTRGEPPRRRPDLLSQPAPPRKALPCGDIASAVCSRLSA